MEVGTFHTGLKTDFLHLIGKDRGLFIALAYYDTGGMDDLALIYHAQHELRHIDVDIEWPEVVG